MLESVVKSRSPKGCTNEHHAHLRRDEFLAPLPESSHLIEVPTLGMPRHKGVAGPRIEAKVARHEAFHDTVEQLHGALATKGLEQVVHTIGD